MLRIAETVQEFEGADPRVVAQLETLDFDIVHMRDDVEDRYSGRDLDEAYQLIMSNQVTGDDFKDLIGKSRYDAQTLFFEDVIVFLFPSERYEAVFASFDYHDDFPVTDLVRHVVEIR